MRCTQHRVGMRPVRVDRWVERGGSRGPIISGQSLGRVRYLLVRTNCIFTFVISTIARNMSNQTNMGVFEQRFKQREHERYELLTTTSQTIRIEPTKMRGRKMNMIIHPTKQVLGGWNECIKSAIIRRLDGKMSKKGNGSSSQGWRNDGTSW